MKRILIGVITVSVLLVSQEASAVTWKRIKDPIVTSSDKSFSVELPVGWVRAFDDRNQVQATRDGLPIQAIEAVRDKHKEAFEHIEKSSAESMLPSELAELAIADMKAQDDMLNITVIENRPALIGAHSGFRIKLTYRNKKGLEYGHIISGYVDKKNLYRIYYRAPMIRFFERDVGIYEQVVKSFKTNDKAFY